jgi:hypothetical protein
LSSRLRLQKRGLSGFGQAFLDFGSDDAAEGVEETIQCLAAGQGLVGIAGLLE